MQSNIQAIIRQITASVTFLPALDDPCTFNLLVYADKRVEAPSEWIDSDPKYILDAEEVRLKPFSTGMHSVGTSVFYKYSRNFAK